MLRIIAAAYKDGWAFVEEGDRIVLVRPPYHRSGVVGVSRGTAERAVHRHGFEVQAREVSDWRALIGLLKERRIGIAKLEGAASLPDRERMERLLRTAPRHILERYLHRVESELLPQGELDAALRMLAAMSRPDIMNMDAMLRELVSKLITACSDAVDRDMASPLDDEDDLAEAFPSAKKTYGVAAARHAKMIQETGQIFAFGR